MSSTRTEKVLHEARWEYRDDSIVQVIPGSIQELLEGYTAALFGCALGASGHDAVDTRRFPVDVLVRHHGGETDQNVGLQFFVDTVQLVDLERGVWAIAGLLTDSGHRVEVLYSRGAPVLVTLTKVLRTLSAV